MELDETEDEDDLDESDELDLEERSIWVPDEDDVLEKLIVKDDDSEENEDFDSEL